MSLESRDAVRIIDRLTIESAGRGLRAEIAKSLLRAPKLEPGPGQPPDPQVPAIQCHIMLHGGAQMAGILSVTITECYRMMVPNEVGGHPNRPGSGTKVMVESFIDPGQITAISFIREIDQLVKSTSGLIVPH